MPSFEYLLELIPRPGDTKNGSRSWSRTYFEFVTGVNSEIPPPPPREAQRRSELLFLLARIIFPLASTISSSIRLSLTRPTVRWSGPIPPPRVMPPIPTVGLSPNGAIYPCPASVCAILPTVFPVPTKTVPDFYLV